MIEIIKKVEVGKYYEVPCVWLSNFKHDFHELVPVIPFLHSDPQFGTDVASQKHFHVDCRFTDSEMDSYFDIEYGRTMRVITLGQLDSMAIHNVLMKCVRKTTGLMPEHRSGRYIPPKTFSWYQDQIGKSCKGRKCPHYGVEMLENGDFLECPLHGLIGSQKTEKIIGNIHQTLSDFLTEISGNNEVIL